MVQVNDWVALIVITKMYVSGPTTHVGSVTAAEVEAFAVADTEPMTFQPDTTGDGLVGRGRGASHGDTPGGAHGAMPAGTVTP